MLNSLLLLAAVFLSSLGTYLLCNQMHKPQKELLDDLRKQNQELLNRLQSEDIRTFASLQHNTVVERAPVDNTYYPRTDAGELAQMNNLYDNYGVEAWGLGETLYEDTEFRDTMKELGFELGPDD